MAKDNDLVTYTVDELKAKRARGESQTDWPRIRAMTEKELEASIEADSDWVAIPRDWYKSAELTMPKPKKALSLRLDPEIVDWFKMQGPGYQTRINAVLAAFIKQAKKEAV